MWTEEMADLNLLTASLYVMLLGIAVEAAYQKIKLLTDREKRKSWDWRDEMLPMLVGIFVVYMFYPLTLFVLLPFQPVSRIIDVVLTSLIISRGANGAHELARFFEGFLGRIIKRW